LAAVTGTTAAPRGRRLPVGLALGAAAAALLCSLPAFYLLVVVAEAPADAWQAIMEADTPGLLVRSIGLAAAVGATAMALGVPIAWLTSRTDLPGRRVFAVLCSLPLVIPSYIGAYLLVSALGPKGALADLLSPLGVERLPSLYGFVGAWLVLSLLNYPLVLLPVRAALARLDPQLEDAARGMGRGRLAVFATVVLPQLMPAAAAGAMLAALYALADFGAVSILRFDSFTREIYLAYGSSFDRIGAAALSLLLVGVMAVVLVGESRFRSRRAFHRSTPGTQRRAAPVRLGKWRWPSAAFCAAVAALAFLLPVAVLVYWSLSSLAGSVDWQAIGAASANTLLVAGLSAAVAAVLAVPIAWTGARHPGRFARLVEVGGTVGYSLPGIVVALAFVFVGIRLVPGLYQSLVLVVVAMVVLFMPLAFTAMRAAFLQISPRLEEAGRSSGRSTVSVAATVVAPLARRGTVAGSALVFLAAAKELPVVLLLSPIGFDTLPATIWRETTRSFFENGAIPALILLAVSAPPLWFLLGRSE